MKIYRLVIDGDKRFTFSGVSPDLTLEDVVSARFGRPLSHDAAAELEKRHTTVDIDVSEDGERFWTLHRRLKGPISGRPFAEVLNLAERTYHHGEVPPTRNPEPMTPDPVIKEVVEATTRSTLIGDYIRAKAVRKQQETNQLLALADLADTLTAGSLEEIALWQLINSRR